MKYAFIIEPGVHAKLSASSADRWTTCAGSVALSAGLPNVSSAYAAQGTAAHYIAAECQKDPTLSPQDWLGHKALVEGHEIELDLELCEAVQEFLDYIAANEKPGDKAMVEQSFTPAMRKLDDEFGGSTDRVMWRESERLLRVYDYKHGAGLPVDVDDNKQLKYYALGALLSNPQYNAEDVELVISQPRCDHEAGRTRTYHLKAIELLEYAADLIDAAKRTREIGADLRATKKACKWCPAAGANKCSALKAQTQALAVANFSPVEIEKYSKEQISEFLKMAPLIEARISAVREFAYQRASHGDEFPGFKLVEKRATRKWTDEEEVAFAMTVHLSHKGFDREELYTSKLKSPTQVEKLIGKQLFAAELHQFVVKKSSGHTLAAAEDPRPAVQSQQQQVLSLFEVPTEKEV